MVKNREKTPFLGEALVRIRLEIEKNTLFGRAFVRVSAKIEKKHTLWQGFWIGLGQNTEKTPFLIGL